MHAVPAHVADQVHLGESYKFTVINPGRGGETVVLACMAALRSQMVVLRSPLSSVLPFSVLPASRQQHARPLSRTISRISVTYHLSRKIMRRVRHAALATRLGLGRRGPGRAGLAADGRRCLLRCPRVVLAQGRARAARGSSRGPVGTCPDADLSLAA